MTAFIKERGYHLTHDELMHAVKLAVEGAFDRSSYKAIFKPDTMTILDLGKEGNESRGVIERPMDWVFHFIKPRMLLKEIQEHIERYEREKIFGTFGHMQGKIVSAYAIGETFHLGERGSQRIDVRKRYEGALSDFGANYGIYVESGKEALMVPPGNWVMWDLAKYLFEKTGYVLSINPIKKNLRLKKHLKAVVWDLNGVDAIMPGDERIPGEDYTQGEWDIILYNVNQTALEGFHVYVSRRQIDFLVKYIKQHIPEFEHMEVLKVARVPGVMAKVLVRKNGTNIKLGQYKDAFTKISELLAGERIQIIFETNDTEELLKNALNYDGSLKVNSLEKTATIITDQKGRVIGKGGTNVKLAGMVTGYKFSIMTMDEYVNDAGIFAGASA